MKIVLIEEWFAITQGGMERVMNLSKALARTGHEVHLFCIAWTSAVPVPEDLGKGLPNLHVHWMPLVEIAGGSRGQLPPEIVAQLGGPTAFPVECVEEYWWNFPPRNEEAADKASTCLADIINEIGPDAIQVSDAIYWVGPGVRAKTGRLTSLLLQSYQIFSSELISMSDLIRAAGKEPPTMAEFLKATQADFEQYDSIWAVSDYFGRRGMQDLHLPEDKMRTHYAGVWLEDFDPEPDPQVVQELGLDGTGKNLLFLGRFNATKGVHHLLSAFPLVLEREPEAKLFIAGAPFMHQQYPDICHYLAGTMGFPDQVQLLGYVSGVQRQTAYASCDVFVNPLVTPESAGIVMVEAMASGKPVVAPNFGYHDEIVTPQRGLLYDPWNTRAMADAIVSLLQDPARCQEMGRNGRQFVSQHLTWEHQAQLAVQLFAEDV